MRRSARISACVLLGSAALAFLPSAAEANPLKSLCGVTGWFNRTAEKACTVLRSPGKVIGAGKKILTGRPAQGVKTLLDKVPSPSSKATAAVTLAAVVAWVLGGARFVLTETAKLLGVTTSPQLGATWFSSAYWRVAGIAALLTLPFLFAAAIQALVRSDLALLTRATFGYLPLSTLAVAIAAPLTMLLLAASDELSAIVSAASGHAIASFMVKAGGLAGLLSAASGSPFVAFMIGLLTVAGALVLWLELLVRAAAVYIVVLMLPLAFAAMVWPARRVWAIRAVEVLVALILAKFAIVAVLSLGGAALNHGFGGGVAAGLAGAVMVILGAFAPWVLLRLLPLAELASGATALARRELSGTVKAGVEAMKPEGWARGWTEKAGDWASRVTAGMRHDAEGVETEQAGDAARKDAARLQALEGTAAGSSDGATGRGLDDAEDTSGEAAARHAPSAGIGMSAPTSAGNGTSVPTSPEPAQTERLPDMDPIWQAPDWTWDPVVLGLADDPPRPRHDPPLPDPQPSGEPLATPNRSTHPVTPRPDPTPDEPDPRPRAQEPHDGRL